MPIFFLIFCSEITINMNEYSERACDKNKIVTFSKIWMSRR